jgi:trans-aconitate methyltransferase
MDQTPVHDIHNADLLRLIPEKASRLIEIGCSSGALAREFRKINPACHYYGIDIVPDYIDLARRYCDEAIALDIETADASFFTAHRDRDCWIFADTLEHLKDPWRILREIRKVIPEHGSIAACIPNAQHWSVIVRLALGDFRYEDAGLLDRTHLRWFTRQTIIELFGDTGFEIDEGNSRIFPDQNREAFLPALSQIAVAAGRDPDTVLADTTAFQYVVRAIPA